MSTCIIVKNEEGRLQGLGERGGRAYARWQSAVQRMEVGETLEFSWREPRSGPFHRRHFAVLSAVFEQQEQFQDFEAFRMWCQVGAGACDILPGPHGKPVAIPRSIAYARMDNGDFMEHHTAVVAFLRSQHATRFLWPDADEQTAGRWIDAMLAEFDR
ncbi:MAG: DUF1367 family protein [Lautropia sp.]